MALIILVLRFGSSPGCIYRLSRPSAGSSPVAPDYQHWSRLMGTRNPLNLGLDADDDIKEGRRRASPTW